MSEIIVEHGTVRIELHPVIDEGPTVLRTHDDTVAQIVPTLANYDLRDLEFAVEAVKRAVGSA